MREEIQSFFGDLAAEEALRILRNRGRFPGREVPLR
jgi:hypothetical protein